MSKKAEWYVIQVISWTEENVKRSLFQRRESLAMTFTAKTIYGDVEIAKEVKVA